MHCLYVLGYFPCQPNSEHGLAYLHWYSTLRVADRLCNDAISSIMCVVLGAGFTLWVGVNVISLKCYNILPLSVYWVMPSLSLIILVLVAVMFSTLVQILAESESQLFAAKIFLANRKGIRQKVNRKLVSRKLRSTRAISLKFGNFFPLTQKSKITYIYDVAMRL